MLYRCTARRTAPQRYILEGRFKEYHGEAVNPKHLSLWEIYVLGWHKQYNPEADKKQFVQEVQQLSSIPAAVHEMERMHVVGEETFRKASVAA